MRIYTNVKISECEVDNFYIFNDSWNDYGFETLFNLYYFNNKKEFEDVGSLKIGKFGMSNKMGIVRTEIPSSFEGLDNDFFSVGQDKNYYESLNKFGVELRDQILEAVCDIAYNEDLYEAVIDEHVTRVSLFRDISPTSVKGEFRRLANGNSTLSEYKFDYLFPHTFKDTVPNPPITFQVIPDSNPPTNIHVLIGRNGVGKTYLLNNMIDALIKETGSNSKHGHFKSVFDQKEIFANLVSVSFSAFDDRMPPVERRDKTKGIQYSHIGLKRFDSDKNSNLKSTTILKNEFVKSIETSLRGSKGKRLKSALKTLSSDPVFKQLRLIQLIDTYNDYPKSDFEISNDTDIDFYKEIGESFKQLSSGHRIVLLTITRLVETVAERSLVLIDEPETHLHPPLLSAFTRALSDLLIKRNGVAIIATHSPVILQEVPKRCVWKLNRVGNNLKAERLQHESFGENVGTLTREVFGLEVTESGFLQLLERFIKSNSSFESIFDSFNGELGLEAQSILRVLLNEKKEE